MKEADPIDSAVSLLYETVLDPTRWDAAMGAVAKSFDAPMVAHWRYDFKAGTATDFRGLGHDMAVQERYTHHYHKLDPGVPEVFRATVGKWVGDEALFDRRARGQREYAVDFALPSDIGWVGGGKLGGTTPYAGLWFGVQRNFDAAPFGAEGERLFGIVSPHLQRVVRIEERMKQLALGQAIAQRSLDALKAAVCVVDSARHCHLLNRAAERMFGGTEPLIVRHGKLMTSPAALDERLAASVALACAQRPPPRGSALQIPRALDTLPLQVIVLPIPQRNELAGLFHEPLALLIVMDPHAPHLTRDAYQSLFGLTAAEAALLFALVNGRTVTEWAAEHGVSVATVRTQLNAVFAKTGADSQPRLMRIAKTLPAVE